MKTFTFLPQLSIIGHSSEEVPAANLVTRVDRMGTAAINVSHLGVQYRMVEALRNVNCLVQPGKLTGIFGLNGAGKSTLIKAMLGLVPVTSGNVLYGGKPLMQQLEKVAYVPQRSQSCLGLPCYSMGCSDDG